MGGNIAYLPTLQAPASRTPSAGALAFSGIAPTVTGSGGTFAGLAVTHYVAPFASVSGSPANDAEDQGATAFTNSSNVNTPCTIGTALARATAGNIVGAKLGTYTITAAQSSGSITIPCFNFANSGSSGNPITLVGEYCPTQAATTSGQRTVFSNGVTSGVAGPVTFGTTGRNYITTRNIYVDENTSRNQGDSGVAYLSGTGNKLIGCYVAGIDADYSGTNHSGVWFNDAVDCGMYNCIVDNISDSGGNQNVAGFHIFTSRNITIQHCIFRNCNAGSYVKFNHGAATGLYGIDISYNRCESMLNYGFRIADPSTDDTTQNYFRQNIFSDVPYPVYVTQGNTHATSPNNWQINNNTAVTLTHFIYQLFTVNAGMGEGMNYYNNLADGGSRFYMLEMADSDLNGFKTAGMTMDYNVGRGLTNWAQTTGGTRATPAAWNSAFAGFDANSQTVSPDQFVDRAGGNFHLNTGVASLTAGNTGGPVGAYITGSEEIGLEAAFQ